MCGRVAVVFAAALLVCAAPVFAKEKDKSSRKLAWAGLVRGPLAPARADALEALLIDELDGYESFRLRLDPCRERSDREWSPACSRRRKRRPRRFVRRALARGRIETLRQKTRR